MFLTSTIIIFVLSFEFMYKRLLLFDRQFWLFVIIIIIVLNWFTFEHARNSEKKLRMNFPNGGRFLTDKPVYNSLTSHFVYLVHTCKRAKVKDSNPGHTRYVETLPGQPVPLNKCEKIWYFQATMLFSYHL